MIGRPDTFYALPSAKTALGSSGTTRHDQEGPQRPFVLKVTVFPGAFQSLSRAVWPSAAANRGLYASRQIE